MTHRRLAAATKNSSLNKYDSATVEEIKAQFQKQIANMLESQERNGSTTTSAARVKTSHIQSSRERELNSIRDGPRGKSFLEARTAVQRQIERMFTEAAAGGNPVGVRDNTNKENIKHTMHGVSHQSLDDDDADGLKPPPPVHYGVNQAIKKAASSDKWESVENIVRQSQARDEIGSRGLGEPAATSAPKPSKFRSMENVRASSGGGLTRTVVDVHNVDDHDVSDRLRKFKMENGKSTPNLSSVSSSSNQGEANFNSLVGNALDL